MAEKNPVAQRQTAVTAHFPSKQLLLFDFARRSVCQYSMAEENPAVHRKMSRLYGSLIHQGLIHNTMKGVRIEFAWPPANYILIYA